jgi:hypothetical protein
MAMNDRLIFTVEGVEHEIALDGSQSPRTLARTIAALPARVDIHCAKIAGSHIMWPVPFVERGENAADVLSLPPGAFFFWPERQYMEITYAALQAETAAVSYLGQLTGDVAWLRDYADRQRRGQGRAIFTAEISVAGGGAAPAPAAVKGSGAWRRLQEARRAAWREAPADVAALLARRGLNAPFGPLSVAEGELRKLHELLWRLWNEQPARAEAETVGIAAFTVEAAIARVAGFCHMAATAAILHDGIACLREKTAPLDDVLVELILYAGRMAGWLDLHICWWPMNELTLAALGEPSDHQA